LDRTCPGPEPALARSMPLHLESVDGGWEATGGFDPRPSESAPEPLVRSASGLNELAQRVAATSQTYVFWPEPACARTLRLPRRRRGNMKDGQTPTPTDVPALDVGDETVSRFSYQWWHTGVLACALLDPETGVIEVFCEHHEDILVKLVVGKFKGIQVKTRQLGLDLWKASDTEIHSALCRFAQLERDFPDQFVEYTIATNHQFWNGKKNGRNLVHLLDTARDSRGRVSAPPVRILDAFVIKIASSSGCPTPVVSSMLAKTRCDDSLPKMDDMQKELCFSLCKVRGESATYTSLERAAVAVHAEIMRAASLAHRQSIPGYLSATVDSADADLVRTIDGKRLTRERVERLLAEHLSATTLLVPAEPGAIRPFPGGHSRLHRKLDAGGLSAATVDVARDCQSSALALQLEWAAKYGEKHALERYNHLRTLAKNEAVYSYEQAKRQDTAFGAAMLATVRSRLERRRQDSSSNTFGCTDEHLLGYVYMLTEECKVWWSTPFEVDDEG
jgi:hypothetical protein